MSPARSQFGGNFLLHVRIAWHSLVLRGIAVHCSALLGSAWHCVWHCVALLGAREPGEPGDPAGEPGERRPAHACAAPGNSGNRAGEPLGTSPSAGLAPTDYSMNPARPQSGESFLLHGRIAWHCLALLRFARHRSALLLPPSQRKGVHYRLERGASATARARVRRATDPFGANKHANGDADPAGVASA